MVQLRSGADVAQEHVVDLWSEIFLGYGVILQQTTATWSHIWYMHTRTAHTNCICYLSMCTSQVDFIYIVQNHKLDSKGFTVYTVYDTVYP